MAAMSSEGDICNHESAGFKFGEDIFFTDTDCYPPWLCEVTNRTSEESSVLYCIENGKYLFSECFTVFLEKMWNTSDTIYTRIWRRTKCEIVSCLWECWYEIVESVIMEFESIFFRYNRCSYISLRSYFDEIIHIHTDTSSCWKPSCRIIWLIDESHLLELFHVIAYCRGWYLHCFVSDERFTPCCVTTFDIFSDDESEDLDFSSINGRLSGHFFYKLKNKREKRIETEFFIKPFFFLFSFFSLLSAIFLGPPQGCHGNFPMRSNA